MHVPTGIMRPPHDIWATHSLISDTLWQLRGIEILRILCLAIYTQINTNITLLYCISLYFNTRLYPEYKLKSAYILHL
jgi:hypothetical protein